MKWRVPGQQAKENLERDCEKRLSGT